MTTHVSRRLFGFGITGMLVVATILLLPLLQGVRWVGRTDLEVRFLLTDRETGQPIPNATIHVRTGPGGFCRDRETREFTIVTDAHGNAKQMCEECMCSGSRSTFENTYNVHLPRWRFYATAIDYSATDPTDLEFGNTVQKVQRGDSFAVISLSIRLQKIATKID
ncbi:hypothetical protein [Schlesneria paludicola]|uniref:hypothetical protein n=1 Tax=Schlesneria paludicola TaxID=360056 RepID=UPI00029B20B6|nr:hypothetical protein [Schlesneria paludicola]